MPTHDNEPISEEELARQLNLPREKIRAERPHLQPGEVSKKGNVISWTRSAGVRLAARLGLALPEKTAPVPEPTPTQPPSGGTPNGDQGEELTVYSSPMGPGEAHFANAFLIKARRAGGEIVVVRVRDSHKFVPRLRDGQPMTFRAKKAQAGNWWLLTGREPRFPGRW